MKFIAVIVVIFVAVVQAQERCQTARDCHETLCRNEDGWFLHCTRNVCLCSHDTYTGKPCADGQVSTCVAAHGTRCQDNGLNWHCVDGVCHCARV